MAKSPKSGFWLYDGLCAESLCPASATKLDASGRLASFNPITCRHLADVLSNSFPQMGWGMYLDTATKAEQPPLKLLGVAYAGGDEKPAILLNSDGLVRGKRGFVEMIAC